jgi:hypothetical protein
MWTRDPVVVEAVSHRPPTAGARVRVSDKSCVICDAQRQVFSEYFDFPVNHSFH